MLSELLERERDRKGEVKSNSQPWDFPRWGLGGEERWGAKRKPGASPAHSQGSPFFHMDS